MRRRVYQPLPRSSRKMSLLREKECFGPRDESEQGRSVASYGFYLRSLEMSFLARVLYRLTEKRRAAERVQQQAQEQAAT